MWFWFFMHSELGTFMHITMIAGYYTLQEIQRIDLISKNNMYGCAAGKMKIDPSAHVFTSYQKCPPKFW